MKETKLVRIDSSVIASVEKHIQKTKQSIGGFFELAAKQKIKYDKLTQKILKERDSNV